ncbi:MAG: type IV secretory system conjugative DNA transfer family protein [Longispora sp.]|nr:type IV secretory system conjugative DNA transfer family protein [Longispora sp. (in: high G+C Gram-positive bacteria)]
MTRTVKPQGSTTSTNDVFYLLMAAAIVTTAVGLWLPVVLARPPGYAGGGPVAVVAGLFKGTITWTVACTVWLVIELLIVAALIAAGWRWRSHRRAKRMRGDEVIGSMAKPADLAHLTGKQAEATARRLQPHLDSSTRLDAGQIGPILMRDLRAKGRLMHASLEDTVVIITGPRRGKTLCLAIPAVVAHHGPVLATANKRDIVDDTRGVRKQHGDVWIFDPQQIAQAEQTWWFNPLAEATNVQTAREIAGIFAAAEREPGAKADAHFDNAARNLITCLILAAAVGKKTLVDVYRWTTNPDSVMTAVTILEDAAAGGGERAYEYVEMARLAAEELAAFHNEPDKMRGSTFGSARTMLNCLANPAYTRWICPGAASRVFDPHAFVTSNDTLYLLSEGGSSSPASLVALLTAAVMRAARHKASRSPNGRLSPALLIILDEAANICRLPDLPKWLSFFGGQGLPMMVVLQSYSQGEGVWGRLGMDSMFDEASHILYLGGLKDPRYLDKLSQLIGEHDITVQSRSNSRQGTSTSTQARRERIISVADLAALPLGRAVLIPSGAPAILGATVPWFDGPHAATIQASHEAYTPRGEQP